MGNGDGTFTRNDAIVPAHIYDYTGQDAGIYEVYLIPIAGRLDMLLSGRNTVWLRGSQSGVYDTSTAVTFQQASSVAYKTPYQMPLDFVYESTLKSFYAHTTAGYSSGTEWAVIKYDTSGSVQSISELWNNPSSAFQAYSAQIKPSVDGNLVAYTGACRIPIDGECLMKVKR